MSFFGLFGDSQSNEQEPAGSSSVWDTVSSAAASLFGGGESDKPAYHLGDSYRDEQMGGLAADDNGLWARVEAGQNDPLQSAIANEGKDIHQLLGMSEPVSLGESNRRFDRGQQRYDAAWSKYQAESNAYNNLDPDDRKSRQARGDFGPAPPERSKFGIG